MMASLQTTVAAILSMFTGVFTTITSEDVLPWIILGVAIPVLSFLVGLFKRIVWGRN